MDVICGQPVLDWSQTIGDGLIENHLRMWNWCLVKYAPTSKNDLLNIPANLDSVVDQDDMICEPDNIGTVFYSC